MPTSRINFHTPKFKLTKNTFFLSGTWTRDGAVSVSQTTVHVPLVDRSSVSLRYKLLGVAIGWLSWPGSSSTHYQRRGHNTPLKIEQRSHEQTLHPTQPSQSHLKYYWIYLSEQFTSILFSTVFCGKHANISVDLIYKIDVINRESGLIVSDERTLNVWRHWIAYLLEIRHSIQDRKHIAMQRTASWWGYFLRQACLANS